MQNFPPSELAQRLLQRATHRVGMIDVRHGEEIHARTAGWAAQRFSLLEHWRTRYTGDEHSSPAMQPLAMRAAAMPFVESSFAQAPGTPAMPAWEGASLMRNAQPAVEPPAGSAPEPGIKLRVKRPNTGHSLASPVETKSPSLPQGNQVRVPGNSAPKAILQRKLLEGSEPSLHVREAGSVGGSLPDMPMQRQRSGLTSVLSPEQPAPSQTGRSIDFAAATRSDPWASESLPQVAELGPASTSASQMRLRRKKSEADAVAVESLPLVRAGKVAEAADSQPRAGGEQSQVVVSPLPQVGELPSPSASAPQMHLQRKQSETGIAVTEFLPLSRGVMTEISASPPRTRREQLRVAEGSVPRVGELPSPIVPAPQVHLQRKQSEKGATAGEPLPLARGGEVIRASDLRPHAASEQPHVVFGPLPQVEELPSPGASAQEMHLQQLRTGDDQLLAAVTSLPQVNELQPPNASTPQMHLQRKQRETGIVAGEVLPVSQGSERTRASDPQPRAASEQSRAIVEPLAQVGKPLIHLRPQQSETGSVAESLPRTGEISIGSDDSPILHLQRKATQSAPDRPATSSTTNGSETTTTAGDRPIPVTREIHFTSGPGAAPMIWRKPDKAGSATGEVSSAAPLVIGSSHFSGFQIMRQNDSGPAPASAPGVSPLPAASSNDGIDVKGMAEQVSRIIARQLVIERERRGKTR